MENLKAFLRACKQRGVHVIGFLPPFTHRVYEALASMPEQYGYLSRLAPALRPAFEETGFGFFDVSDLASVGAPDVEALDPVHPSEKASLRLFMRMAQNNAVLREVTADETYLSARLNQSRSYYEVFGDDRR